MESKEQSRKTISLIISEIVTGREDSSHISLGEIVNQLHERGFGVLMVLFSLPMAIPLPYPPGFTTILGVPLFFLAYQMLLGYDKPWLPEKFCNYSIKVSVLRMISAKSANFLNWLERVLKPRWFFMSTLTGERIIGLFALLCSISVILPIMFGNAVPSAGIFIMSLGLLNKDGLVIILGMIVSIIGLIVSALVVILGVKAVQAAFFAIYNYFF